MKMIHELEKWRRLKDQNMCPDCKRDMTDAKFDNELSKTEFKISGLCQVCQDNVFGKDDD